MHVLCQNTTSSGSAICYLCEGSDQMITIEANTANQHAMNPPAVFRNTQRDSGGLRLLQNNGFQGRESRAGLQEWGSSFSPSIRTKARDPESVSVLIPPRYTDGPPSDPPRSIAIGGRHLWTASPRIPVSSTQLPLGASTADGPSALCTPLQPR